MRQSDLTRFMSVCLSAGLFVISHVYVAKNCQMSRYEIPRQKLRSQTSVHRMCHCNLWAGIEMSCGCLLQAMLAFSWFSEKEKNKSTKERKKNLGWKIGKLRQNKQKVWLQSLSRNELVSLLQALFALFSFPAFSDAWNECCCKIAKHLWPCLNSTFQRMLCNVVFESWYLIYQENYIWVQLAFYSLNNASTNTSIWNLHDPVRYAVICTHICTSVVVDGKLVTCYIMKQIQKLFSYHFHIIMTNYSSGLTNQETLVTNLLVLDLPCCQDTSFWVSDCMVLICY